MRCAFAMVLASLESTLSIPWSTWSSNLCKHPFDPYCACWVSSPFIADDCVLMAPMCLDMVPRRASCTLITCPFESASQLYRRLVVQRVVSRWSENVVALVASATKLGERNKLLGGHARRTNKQNGKDKQQANACNHFLGAQKFIRSQMQ